MRGKKIPLETLEKIKKLRSEGYSLPELSKEFSTPKTTIFRYIKGIKILPEYNKIWLGKRGGSKKLKLIKEEKALNEATVLLKDLSYKEKLLFISALYWGEGSKKEFGLSNTDPKLIKVFIDGLREIFGISNKRFRVSVRIYEDLDKDKCLCFWSDVVGIPKEKFVNVNVLRGKKKGKLKYGMCRVRVSKGGDLLKKILAVNKVTGDLFVPIA